MARYALFLVPITHLRDAFGADDELAARLREVALTRLAPRPAERTLLDSLGPLQRRHRATEVRAVTPGRADVEVLLRGASVPDSRRAASWQVVVAWLEELSRACHLLEVPDRDDAWLRLLAAEDLRIPLLPVPGMLAGYTPNAHLAAVRSTLPPGVAGDVVGLLAELPDDANLPVDLVVVQRP